MSHGHAVEMLLSGDAVAADRAAEIDPVNRAVPPDAVRDTAMELVSRIASESGLVLASGKRAFHEQREMVPSQVYEYASNVMVENMLARDSEEGIGALVEKRAPQRRHA